MTEHVLSLARPGEWIKIKYKKYKKLKNNLKKPKWNYQSVNGPNVSLQIF